MENILEECRRLAESGVTELNLVAQDTTRYGEDLYGESRLPELIDAVCALEKVHWVRVLYCYPTGSSRPSRASPRRCITSISRCSTPAPMCCGI